MVIGGGKNMIKKFLIWIGLLKPSQLDVIDVVLQFDGQAKISLLTICVMKAPNLSGLRIGAGKYGWQGNENYREIDSFLEKRSIIAAWYEKTNERFLIEPDKLTSL